VTSRPTGRRRGAVVTIGTFDGVHRGHQTILRRAAGMARRMGIPALAVTFHQPPRLFFFPSDGPVLITLLSEKADLLRSYGIDRMEALRFGKDLAALSADAFFDRYLLARFGARALVVGYNFGFGRGRQGDTRFLERRGAEAGIPVVVVPPVCDRGVPVSSGRVREHLFHGDLAAARRLTGHAHSVSGRVVRGDGLGRRLGFPTANLRVDPAKIVPPGVFAARAVLPDGRVRRAMCNVGTRPTVRGAGGERRVEAHLLDFSGDLRGMSLRLEFAARLREEKAFDGLPALVRQLGRDKARLRRFRW
jgi:riboflavin kinase/FMN adenylyltransferase